MTKEYDFSDRRFLDRRDFKGQWFTREILLDRRFSWIERALIVEIDSLDKGDHMGCYASNEYLAEWLDVSPSRVAHIIGRLKRIKVVAQIYFDGKRRGLRVIDETLALSKMTMLDGRVVKNDNAGLLKMTTITNKTNSSFPKEKEEGAPTPRKRGKRVKYPGEEIFDLAKEKYPDVVTVAMVKKYKADFVEHFTEGDGQLITHVNWPLTFKNWVRRGEAWNGGRPEDNGVQQRVVTDYHKTCALCAEADKVGRPCPIHKKGGKAVGKTNTQNVQP